jgi:hypothetical protein
MGVIQPLQKRKIIMVNIKLRIYKSTAYAWRNVAILSASIVIILYVHTSLAPPALPSCIRILISI